MFLAALLCSGSVTAQGPVFRNPNNFDGEYALDLLSNELPPDWRASYRRADSGVQIGGGSLNIRHIVLAEDIKFHMPLSGDRLAFRFRRERRAGLERDDVWNLLEFEGRVAGPWHLSLLGNPSFHKSDATIGAATAWRAGPGRYARFSYLWPRFDTNYAFRNTSVNEGYTEAFRHYPGEARFEVVWQEGGHELFLDARHGRPWELAHENFDTPPTGYVEKGDMSEVHGEARHHVDAWTWGFQADYWRAASAIAYDPARPAEDQRAVWEHHRLFLTLERAIDGKGAVRAGVGPSYMRGTLEVPAQPADDNAYRYTETLALLSYLPRWSPKWSGEATYLIDFQHAEITQGSAPASVSPIHNRMKFALRWDGAFGSFVVAGNVELDQSDAESTLSFDGGTLQFQATF